MDKEGKVVPPKKHILKDVSLSFFPGAKIGVLGLNGAGKSTLLKIMARMAAFEELASQEFQKRNETQELYTPPGERLDEQVFELNGVAKEFDHKLLYEDLSFQVPRGAIVGIIGPQLPTKDIRQKP